MFVICLRFQLRVETPEKASVNDCTKGFVAELRSRYNASIAFEKLSSHEGDVDLSVAIVAYEGATLRKASRNFIREIETRAELKIIWHQEEVRSFGADPDELRVLERVRLTTSGAPLERNSQSLGKNARTLNHRASDAFPSDLESEAEHWWMEETDD